MIKDKTVYATQKSGPWKCGDFDDRVKYNVKCPVLEGTCTKNSDCDSGLVCDKLEASKTLVVPKFHHLDNKYCQVEFCSKYAWADKTVKCGTCSKGYEGDLCTKAR